jgi:cysteinyl-tRNA synthetase
MLEDCDPGTFRFFVLSAHYRTPIDFTDEALEQSRRSLERIRQLMNVIEEQLETPGEFQEPEESSAILAEARDKFMEAMDDDFNTPNALRAVFEMVRDVNRRINEKGISRKTLQDVKQLLAEFGEVLGIDFSAGKKEAASGEGELTVCLIELLIEMRQKLRDKRDWELADEIRDRMKDLNIILEDAKTGGGKYAIKRA